MNWKKVLTPRDTEEIKPGLFIQTRYRKVYDNKGDLIAREPVSYRQIEPLFWNGKFRKKEQLATVFSVRTFFTLAIICFIVFAYLHDTKTYREFYTRVMENPVSWCENIYEYYNPYLQNYYNSDGENGTIYTNPLQGYS